MNEIIRQLSKHIRESMETLRELQKDAEFDEKQKLAIVLEGLIQSQTLIMDVLPIYQKIVDEKQAIEEKAKHYEQWKENESDYISFRLVSGSTVIIPKAENKSEYAKEWYCKHCFDKREKIQLQKAPKEYWHFQCPNCKTLYPLDASDIDFYQQVNVGRINPRR